MVKQEDKLRGVGHVEVLKYKGIFDLDKVFKTIIAWYTSHNYEFQEDKYKHKVPPPGGMEWELSWRGWRKVNEYVKFDVIVEFHIWDFKWIEVVKDGKKQKLAQGRIQIEFEGTLTLDYQNRFYGNKFLQVLQDLYQKYIIKQKIENIWEDELYYRILKLFSETKEALGMATSYNAAESRW